MRVCVCVCAQSLSHVRLFVTTWTVAHQAALSVGFPRQEYWSGLPFHPPGDLPDPGTEPTSSASSVGGFFTTEPPGKLILWLPRGFPKVFTSQDKRHLYYSEDQIHVTYCKL